MLKILIKLGLSGGAVAGSLALTSPLLISPSDEKEEVKERIKDIVTFEDIDIYARIHGCNFAFVSKWLEGKVYAAEQFVEKETVFHKKDEWKQKVLSDVKNNKEKCKAGTTVTFSYEPNSGLFSVKKL